MNRPYEALAAALGHVPTTASALALVVREADDGHEVVLAWGVADPGQADPERLWNTRFWAADDAVVVLTADEVWRGQGLPDLPRAERAGTGPCREVDRVFAAAHGLTFVVAVKAERGAPWQDLGSEIHDLAEAAELAITALSADRYEVAVFCHGIVYWSSRGPDVHNTAALTLPFHVDLDALTTSLIGAVAELRGRGLLGQGVPMLLRASWQVLHREATVAANPPGLIAPVVAWWDRRVAFSLRMVTRNSRRDKAQRVADQAVELLGAEAVTTVERYRCCSPGPCDEHAGRWTIDIDFACQRDGVLSLVDAGVRTGWALFSRWTVSWVDPPFDRGPTREVWLRHDGGGSGSLNAVEWAEIRVVGSGSVPDYGGLLGT